MLSFPCYNPMPCDFEEINCFVVHRPSVWGWGEECVVISDQVLGVAEQPFRQSLRVFLLGVDKYPKLGCPSLEVPTSLCTAQAASRKGRVVASRPLFCSLSLASRHVLVVLQAGFKMNHWPCLLSKSQTHPHTMAQQQDPHPCPIQGRLVGAQSCLLGHERQGNSLTLTEML